MFERFKARQKLPSEDRMIIGLNSTEICLEYAAEKNRSEMFAYLLRYECKKPGQIEYAALMAIRYNRPRHFQQVFDEYDIATFLKGTNGGGLAAIAKFMLSVHQIYPTYLHDQLFFLNRKQPSEAALPDSVFMELAFKTGRTNNYTPREVCGDLAPACSMDYYFEKDGAFHNIMRRAREDSRYSFLWTLSRHLLTNTDKLKPEQANEYIEKLKDIYAEDIETLRASATGCLVNILCEKSLNDSYEVTRRIFLMGVDFQGRRTEILAAANKSYQKRSALRLLEQAGFDVSETAQELPPAVPPKKQRLRLEF